MQTHGTRGRLSSFTVTEAGRFRPHLDEPFPMGHKNLYTEPLYVRAA